MLGFLWVPLGFCWLLCYGFLLVPMGSYGYHDSCQLFTAPTVKKQQDIILDLTMRKNGIIGVDALRRRRIVSPAFAPDEIIDTPSLRSATNFWVRSSRSLRTRCFAAAAMDPKPSANVLQAHTHDLQPTYNGCSAATLQATAA